MPGQASDVTIQSVESGGLSLTNGGGVVLVFSNQGSPHQRAIAMQKWVAQNMTHAEFETAKTVMESDGTVFMWFLR